MGVSGTTLSALALLLTLTVVVPALIRDNGVVGKREARLELEEIRKHQESNVMKRSAKTNFEEEEAEIDLIERVLGNIRQTEEEEEEPDSGSPTTTRRPPEGGEKLILEALKGNVDPNSEVVNLLESMYVDDGFRHNQHPDGIMEIASKKDKVYGDKHDGHRWTQQELDEFHNNGGRKRNFYLSATLWSDKIIPYTIHSSLSGNTNYVNVIKQAMKQFDDYTCLRWVPDGSTEDTASYSSYIEFFSESGCWSYIGRAFDNKQQISLQAPGCVSLSTTIHEMTHAIGQHHEQSRSDRDSHVTMMWSNIQGGTSNFNMQKVKTLDNNPYDVQSVLQYSLKAFSTNGKPTIVLKDPRLDFLADSATGLMFYDIKDITDAYDCTISCKGPNGDQPLKQCQNEGFVLHNCNCHCPDGVTGTLCETVMTDPVCGAGIIELADGESRTITSPNFDNGGPYPTGKNCVWIIKAPVGKFVGLTINEMDLTTTNGACDHWLEIRYNLLGQTGPRRCGQFSGDQYMTSEWGNQTLMMLKFDNTFAASATAGKGFNLTVSTENQVCQSRPCVHGTCSENPNDAGYLCTCENGFTGTNCDFYAGTADFSCSFENENCLFINSPSNSFNWMKHSGSTPSSNTGPSGAKSGQYYQYAEMSSPVTTGTKFHLESLYINAGPRCLTFWYHMYGGSMGTLNVLRNDSTVVWTKSGDQGNLWHKAEVDIGTTNLIYKIIIEAVRGSSWNSDIAIDDVSLTTVCSGTTLAPTTQAPTTQAPTTQAPTTQAPTTQAPTTQAPTTQAPTTQAPTTQAPTTQAPTTQAPTTQPTAGTITCTFDDPSCFLSDISGDDMDWTIRSGSTPSSNTGPSASLDRNYAYIEASSPRQTGDKALLSSESISLSTTGSACLFFSYNMYGSNMGTLNVLAGDRGSETNVWTLSGDQGDVWTSVSIDIPSSDDLVIKFEGIRGSGYRSDIAIDSVRLSDTPCTACSTTIPCLNGGTCLGNGNGASCSCTSGFTGSRCEIAVVSITSCTFDGGASPCFLSDVGGDDMDWTIRSGSTPSSNTGPSASLDGNYAYIEASSPRQTGDKALLSSESISLSTTGSACLFFSYHMYGSNMGTLNVLAGDRGSETNVWTLSGDQGDVWTSVSIDIPSSDDLVIKFEGIRGSGYRSDIAIDSVRLSDTPCTACSTTIPCLNGGTCLGNGNVASCSCTSGFTGSRCEIAVVSNASCTFDGGASPCFLSDVGGDNMDWSIKSGSTPSSNTGPSASLDGNYAYIEASSPRQTGDKALLSSESIIFDITGPSCLAFFYNMYGSNMGTLNVLAGDRGSESNKWTLSGNQGDVWTSVSIDIPSSNDLVIKIEGIRGSGYRSDIAIDNVQFSEGACAACSTTPCLNGGTCLETAPGASCLCTAEFTGSLCEISVTGDISCGFEDTYCQFSNLPSNAFDWTRRSGSTPSSNTGPSGARTGTYYQYVETSSPVTTGTKFHLESPYITAGPRCLEFWYHMYGTTMGTLNVLRNSSVLWTRSGDQGNTWQQATVDIGTTDLNYKITFEAVRGSSWKSDIAIDDVSISAACD